MLVYPRVCVYLGRTFGEMLSNLGQRLHPRLGLVVFAGSSVVPLSREHAQHTSQPPPLDKEAAEQR